MGDEALTKHSICCLLPEYVKYLTENIDYGMIIHTERSGLFYKRIL